MTENISGAELAIYQCKERLQCYFKELATTYRERDILTRPIANHINYDFVNPSKEMYMVAAKIWAEVLSGKEKDKP